jgi:nicotinamidase-related amidase
MSQALLIIDMQVGSFGKGADRHDVSGLIDRLNILSGHMRESGGTVIYVQHDGPPDDPHFPGKPGWEVLPALVKKPDDLVVRKTSCDSFLDTNLEDVLRGIGAEELIITGCATDYCVDTTIRSALAKRYATTVPTDGHTTANRPHLTAVQIMEHHHAVWSDFIAPTGPARLTTCAEIAS